MKTKLSVSILICSVASILLSCQKDHSEISSLQSSIKLKQVLLFSDINSPDPIGIVNEYEYNEKGLISKVSTPAYENGKIGVTLKYDLYEYNSSDQLIKIMDYNSDLNSPTGFINLQNTTYLYSAAGKKIKETIEYPIAGIMEYSEFEYSAGFLVKVRKFTHNVLESYTEYQYNKSGILIKELFYSADSQCLSYTVHSYTGPLQTGSDIYLYSDKSHFRSIIRTFDNNNNLIILESKELSLYSNMLSFVLRYKYYE